MRFFLMSLIFILISCSKTDRVPNTTSPALQDTFTNGWSRVRNDSLKYNDVFFTSSTNGYLIGFQEDSAIATLFKSTDGGLSWLELMDSAQQEYSSIAATG